MTLSPTDLLEDDLPLCMQSTPEAIRDQRRTYAELELWDELTRDARDPASFAQAMELYQEATSVPWPTP